MLAAFGVDVLDPRTSLRRVRVLMERLPPGAWPDQYHEMNWSNESYLLANVIDGLNALNYTLMRANGAKPHQPKPFPRPKAAKPPPKQRVGWGEFIRTLASGDVPGIELHRDG